MATLGTVLGGTVGTLAWWGLTVLTAFLGVIAYLAWVIPRPGKLQQP